jgi:hypothetical protein
MLPFHFGNPSVGDVNKEPFEADYPITFKYGIC